MDPSLRAIYEPFIRAHYQGPCPTLADLWRNLNQQPHPRAQELALALELFATGSLSMFAQPTNVDMSNRLICFNIQSLGEQLKPVAMLSMLEFISTCVTSGERNDPEAAAWVYFDEIYLLLQNELSAHFLFNSWKRFRKYNAYATGITQNVEDCLTNTTAYSMLANSEFLLLYNQASTDRAELAKLLNISQTQMSYITNAEVGSGLIRVGSAIVPFVNKIPRDTELYKLMTTTFGEAV